MTLLTIPLESDQQDFVEASVKNGLFASKSDLGRKAIALLQQELALQEVLLARAEIDAGRGLVVKGNIKTFVASLAL
jgi:Arc/MetJ-type ribon-helix-helix transcriptional regulator